MDSQQFNTSNNSKKIGSNKTSVLHQRKTRKPWVVIFKSVKIKSESKNKFPSNEDQMIEKVLSEVSKEFPRVQN